MANEKNYICCKDHGYKKIYSSHDYEWRICEKCDFGESSIVITRLFNFESIDL